MTNQNKRIHSIFRTIKVQWAIIIISILIYASFYIPVPYYITLPGSAMILDNVVEVSEGFEDKGDFMLTTVSMIPGNIPYYLYAQFSNYAEIIPKEYLLTKDEDPEDYNKRQVKVMEQSQDNAILAAFNQLSLPIEIKNKGILVMGLSPGLPSEKILEVGDLITEVDDIPMKKIENLLAYLEKKKVGEDVKVEFIRDNKTYSEEITLANLTLNVEATEDEVPEKAGIGFYPFEDREVIPSKEVTFHTKEIGGPSAGLMFTLEIINQLTAEDLTKGYQIAGTGTINPEGVVGQIGGARLKVKAAYKKGVEIFFVPKDIEKDDTNQKNAEQANRELGNPMKIVPVSNVNEAMEFLKQLPIKKEL